MKRLAILFSLFVFSPAAAHADGCPPQSCGTSSVQEPGSGLLLVRPSGQQGPLVAYDAASGKERFQLGRGLLAGSSFFTAKVVDRVRTTLTLHNTGRDGRAVRVWHFRGNAWPGAASANGEWVVLQFASKQKASRFAVIDAHSGKVVDRIQLRGQYQAEAIAPNGRQLFLIHWTKSGYDLQTYDFAGRTLRPTTLAEPDEKMTGTAWSAVATRNGRWLLTLYVGGGENGAFIHALDLRAGIAHCIDLPWRFKDLNRVGAAALAVSPDDRRLYLANPALGRIAVVDLRKLRVVGDANFPGLRGNVAFTTGTSAAVSPRGRVLAFGTRRSVWLYDTAFGNVRGPFVVSHAVPARTGTPMPLTGLAFARDGKRLLALRGDRRSVIFDARTGRVLRGVPIGELFTIRPTGSGGPVAGYASGAGQRFFLPQGRSSADGARFFTSYPRGRGSTAIERYDPATGRLVGTRTIPGRWRLGAVSAGGAMLALAHQQERTTYVQVLDARTYRPVHARTLRGVYTLDAVTDDGERLFLIQHYRGGSYAVRALDFAANRLWTATLREKGAEEQPEMTGIAASQVASPDGEWLLTLYLNTKERKAFVHALNLQRAFAVCIDLPSRSRTLRPLRDYSLTLAPDGDVYAANGALGVLARIDLRREDIASTLRFDGTGRSGGWAASALARDGSTLWFSSGRHLWRYDTRGERVRGPRVATAPVLGLAVSRDGRRLFAARVDGAVWTLAA